MTSKDGKGEGGVSNGNKERGEISDEEEEGNDDEESGNILD